MTPEELAREFEKAPKNLMKARPNELLFEEDYPEGRMKFVCAAMNREYDSLVTTVRTLMAQPDGARHLVRALNNLKEIGHHGALCFAKAIYDTLENDWDDDTRMLKFLQILDAVSSDLRTGLEWLSEKAAQMLDGSALSGDTRFKLWIHWCMAVLRSSPDATPLIEQLAPRRPNNLSKSNTNALRDALKDEKLPWDMRSAAVFLLLGNQLIQLSKAQDFVEAAYASFPLEALEGVEILALAVENDATALAEFDVIQSKLAQIRRENLYIRDMNANDFAEASIKMLQELNALPNSALEIAVALPDEAKNLRLVKTSLIDDARRADWLFVAKKNNLLRKLGLVFFKNLNTDNSLVLAFSADLVTALLDNVNADAIRTECWLDAVQTMDAEKLNQEKDYWISFCEE